MRITRRKFLAATCGAAAGLVARTASAAVPASQPVGRMRSIKWITYEYEVAGRPRRKSILRGTTTDGIVGAADSLATGREDEVAAALDGVDIFDHQAVWKRLVEGNVGNIHLRAAVDMLCWDLHARTRKLPLHALLSTKRAKYRPYGDERWADSLTVESYARRVAGAFARRGNLCTKLHIPGTYHLDRSYARGIGEKGWDLPKLLNALREVRSAVGSKVALAYDPHPQVSASLKPDEAKQVARVLDECRYEWVECLLPPEPDRMKEWLDLRKGAKLRFQREESPSQTADMEIRWLEAGAANQVTWDCRFGGITEILRVLEWIREHPQAGAKVNLHYSHASHEHIAAATTDEEYPWVEACFARDRYEDGWTKAPNWPGVINVDWAFVEKHRV